MTDVSRNGHLLALLTMAILWVFSAPSAADDSDIEARLKRLDEQVKAQAAEIQALRNELAQSRADNRQPDQPATREVVAEEVAREHHATESAQTPNQLSFRGGYTQGSSVSVISLADSFGGTPRGAKGHVSADVDGYYVGATLDRQMTGDLWGLWPRVSLGAEFMLEFVETQRTLTDVGSPNELQVNQLLFAVSPKARLNGLGRVEPWLVPAGLVIAAIQDESEFLFGDELTVSPGVMVGTGVDYRVWKDFHVGVDFRYLWLFSSDREDDGSGSRVQLNRTLDGFQAGANVGVRF